MIESRKIKLLKWIAGISVIFIMLGISAVTVFAAGDVSSAIQNTWNSAQTQINRSLIGSHRENRFPCLVGISRG